MAFTPSIGDVLRASVASDGHLPEDVVARLSPRKLAGLTQAARFHGIPGYVYRAVSEIDRVPAAERDLIVALRRETVRRHLRAIGDLRFLADVLESAGIPWLVFKGPALAGVHGPPDLRYYNDLDVLVPAGRFGEVVRLLEAAGCRVPLHDWAYLRDGLKGEIDVFLPSGTHLDLHWHLLNEIPTRQPYRIDLDAVFSRRRDVTIGSDRFPTLAPLDAAVHVALHALLSPTQRLVGMKDLQVLIEVSPLSQHALLGHARSWGAELPVRTALFKMERSIGTIPAIALEPPRGAERLWDGVCRFANRLTPLERQDGTASLGRLVARSVRGDVNASLALLVRNAGIVVTRGSQAGIRTPQARLASSTDPARGPVEPDNTHEREEYFAAVEAQAGRS